MAWEAGDAGEALEVLERRPAIGVVFTDVNMPGEMDGLGFAHEVSLARPDVKIIVTSGAVTVPDEDLPGGDGDVPPEAISDGVAGQHRHEEARRLNCAERADRTPEW